LPERERRVVDDGAFASCIGDRRDGVVDKRRVGQAGDGSTRVGASIDAPHHLTHLVVLLLAESGQDGIGAVIRLGVLCASLSLVDSSNQEASKVGVLTVEGTAVAVTGDDDYPDGGVRVGHGETRAAFVRLEQSRGRERMILKWGESNESRANVGEQRGREGVLCVKLRSCRVHSQASLGQASRRGDSPLPIPATARIPKSDPDSADKAADHLNVTSAGS
jgi:hypothetical protein